MKRICILFLMLYFCNSVNSQDYTVTGIPVIVDRSNLSIGLSNQFFRYNGKGFSTISPTVELKLLKHFYILSQYERFRNLEIVDISNVRDGQPRIISKKNTYQHIPLTLKYCFIDKQKIDFYLNISGINQFRENIISVYTYNNPTETSGQNEYNVLYGFSVGFDFVVCQKSKVGLEIYFKNGKNLYSEIFGINLNYMFNLNLNNHEK